MKTKTSEMKNTMDEINGRLDITEENVSEADSMVVETIENETKKKESFSYSHPPMKRIYKMKVNQGRQEERKNFEEVMVGNFLNLMKTTNVHIEESP